MADIDPSLWDQAINGYNRGPVPAPAIPPVDLSALEDVQIPEQGLAPVEDTPITPSALSYPTAEMFPAGVAAPGGVMPQPAGQAVAAPAPETPQYTAPKTFDQSIQDFGQQAQEQAKAVREQAEAQAQSLEQEAELHTARAIEVKAQEEQQRAEYADAVKVKDQVEADWTKLHEENANTEIEYKETTQSKVAGALALVGAGIADGFARMGGNNGTNYVAQAQAGIDRAVQMDLQRQEKRLANRKDAEKSKYLELSLARQKLGDTPEAKALAQALIAQRYGAEIKAQSAKSQSESMRAEGAALGEGVETNATAAIAKLKQADLEQRMRSRAAGAGLGGGGGSFNLDEIRAKIAGGQDLSAAELKAANTAGMFRAEKSTDSKLSELEELEKTGDITAKQQASLDAHRKSVASLNGDKPDTADQAKARLLYASMDRPAKALEERMKTGRFPATSQSLAEKLGVAPDEWNKEAALFAQEIEAVGNDLLRYESGASISTQETEGLIKRARSTDADIRNAAVQRLLDKRAALKGAFPERKSEQKPAGQVKATGGEARQEAPAKTASPGKTLMATSKGKFLVDSSKVDAILKADPTSKVL